MPELVSIITNPIVQQHFAEMFQVGLKLNQESGFMVYGSAEFEVSKLLIPKIDVLDGLEAAFTQMRRFDPAPLTVQHPRYGYESSAEARRAKAAHELSSRAVQKIAAIEEVESIPERRKNALKRAIAKRDWQPRDNVRQDIALFAHNHPQDPGEDAVVIDAATKTLPSWRDVDGYAYLKEYSPNVINAVAAADYKQQKVLFYAAKSGSEITPSVYGSRRNRQRGFAYNIGHLCRAGFTYTVLNLSESGEADDESLEMLNSFQNEIS